MFDFITEDDVRQAQSRIKDHVVHTPVVPSPADSTIKLKLETKQDIGAFKQRGAFNKMLGLDKAQQDKGVVTVSTGNHGRAVAFAAHKLGIKAIVCMSKLVPANKVNAIKELGAEVIISGDSQDDAEIKARELVREQGMTLIHPFDDIDVVAGQATIGLELLEQVPDLSRIYIPLSGGGLLAGIGFIIKQLKPEIQIIGVSSEKCPAMAESLKAGKPIEVHEHESLADSLGGGIGLENKYTFRMTQKTMDRVMILGEADIKKAMRALYQQAGIITEGAGAISHQAAIQDNRKDGDTAICLITGQNIDEKDFMHVVSNNEE